MADLIAAPMDYGMDEEVMEMTHDGRVQPVKTKLTCTKFEMPEGESAVALRYGSHLFPDLSRPS